MSAEIVKKKKLIVYRSNPKADARAANAIALPPFWAKSAPTPKRSRRAQHRGVGK